MSSVEDDGGKLPQGGKRAHVDDEVVVAETGSPFGEGDAVAAALANLLDGMAHVGGSDKLAFLDVDGPSMLLCCFGCGDEKVGLPAEEGGYLEDVHSLGDTSAVLGGVDIGEDWEIICFGYSPEDASAFHDTRSAEAMDRGSVGLVIAGLEDIGDAEV